MPKHFYMICCHLLSPVKLRDTHIIACLSLQFIQKMSRLEQKWFISVRGESKKNAIEVSRCCDLRAQPGSRYLQ